jgi:hypothetical protein
MLKSQTIGKRKNIALTLSGNELGSKLQDYAHAGVAYYVVFDPLRTLSETSLRTYELRGGRYEELLEPWLEQIQMGFTLWDGVFEGKQYQWLRWCDRAGNLLLTGDEKAEQEHQRAEQEHQRAEQEHQRAEQEHQRAEQEHQRAEHLAELLRAQGIDPNL